MLTRTKYGRYIVNIGGDMWLLGPSWAVIYILVLQWNNRLEDVILRENQSRVYMSKAGNICKVCSYPTVTCCCK